MIPLRSRQNVKSSIQKQTLFISLKAHLSFDNFRYFLLHLHKFAYNMKIILIFLVLLITVSVISAKPLIGSTTCPVPRSSKYLFLSSFFFIASLFVVYILLSYIATFSFFLTEGLSEITYLLQVRDMICVRSIISEHILWDYTKYVIVVPTMLLLFIMVWNWGFYEQYRSGITRF